MSIELARLVSEAAGLVMYVYWVFGLVAGWLVRWFVPSAPSAPFFRIPEPHFFPLFFLIWLFAGFLATFLAVYEQNYDRYELSAKLLLDVDNFRLSALINAVLEELVRVGTFILANGSWAVGILVNNLTFGFIHLDIEPSLIGDAPLILLFWTLGAGAFGFALLAVALRFGIFWAILLHFLVNSGRVILVASDMVFNYAIFVVSTALLAYLGYRIYREYLAFAVWGSRSVSPEE